MQAWLSLFGGCFSWAGVLQYSFSSEENLGQGMQDFLLVGLHIVLPEITNMCGMKLAMERVEEEKQRNLDNDTPAR